VGRRMSRQGPGRSPSMGLTHLNAARPREKVEWGPALREFEKFVGSRFTPACNTSITISSIAERCFFFLPRGRRCPHRGLATRWAVVARGPSLDIHARHLDSTTRTSARSRVSRLSSRCGTGRAAHRHTHTSHRACRPGPSATPRQAALSMTPLTHRSSQPLRDYMLRTRDNG